jgi:putative nucleotidyltransferase with HDIG domain
MRPIHPLELVGHEKLDFDLYNDKGELLYEKGKILSPGLLIKLCHIKVFTIESSDENFDSNLTDNQGILKYKSVISNRVAKTLATLSRVVLKKVSGNENPDISTCHELADIIVEEVNNNLEKIECISQLKIFDEYIFSHTINVSTMSSALGITLGFEENEIKELALGALLHDIGKMLIPRDILNKPAKLEPDEFEIIKSHPLLGYRYILDNLNLPDKIAKVALDHQENYYGDGYPNGLKGKEINLYAQITAIVDVYDALTSNRVYQRAVESDKAIDIMLSESHDRFNPYILSKFMRLVDYNNKNAFNLGNNKL